MLKCLDKGQLSLGCTHLDNEQEREYVFKLIQPSLNCALLWAFDHSYIFSYFILTPNSTPSQPKKSPICLEFIHYTLYLVCCLQYYVTLLGIPAQLAINVTKYAQDLACLEIQRHRETCNWGC